MSAPQIPIPPPTPPMPELTRPFVVDRLGDGATVVVEAAEAERRAVATRLGVVAVAALRCRWTLRVAAATDRIEADGLLEARLTRDCVVSLEPFEADVVEAFGVLFVPEAELAEVDEDPEAPDELPFDGRTIDLGEATVEQLALALDPFPRAPGATLDSDVAGDAANPFAILAKRLPRA